MDYETKPVTCNCAKICESVEEYVVNHVDTIHDWDDKITADNYASEYPEEVIKMLAGEPWARKRREEQAAKRAEGYVPKATAPAYKKKAFCMECVVVNDVVVVNNCKNKKCSYNHGQLDRREWVRKQLFQ
jgi:hypothetical protein